MPQTPLNECIIKLVGEVGKDLCLFGENEKQTLHWAHRYLVIGVYDN